MFDEAIYDRLKTDSTFLNLLPGGVHYELGEQGLSRENVPEAYDTDGLLQPTCVVTGRGTNPLPGAPRDTSNQFRVVRQVVELWFYDDRDTGYAAVQAAREQAFTLLEGQPLDNTYSLEWLTDIKTRADELQGACLLRSDYEVIA